MITCREAHSLLVDAGCSDEVITHSETVCQLATTYATGIDVADRALVMAGSLLHDIGRSQTHTIRHAQEGADICRANGVPEPVARIVERHVGAGLTADECTLLGLKPRDCIPISIEERMVANADNLVRGNRIITIDERMLIAAHLPSRSRHRIYRLWIEMEQFLPQAGNILEDNLFNL
jgi:uncharacterized protein